MLEPPKFTLDGGAATVEPLPIVAVARQARLADTPPPHATGQVPADLPPGYRPVPAVELVSGNTLTMLTMSFVVSGYQLDRTRCTASHGKLTLTPHGLPQTMTLDRDARAVFHDRCVAPRMLVRIRLTTDAAGIPLRAKLFVARPAGSKPLVYVDWSRTKVTAYASGDCVAME